MRWRRISFLVLNLALIGLMIKAGFWQLDRATQKQAILDRGAQTQALADTDALWQQSAEELSLKTVQLIGELDVSKIWLLDNKVHQGEVGYEVLLALTPSDSEKRDKRILVNLGWVSGLGDRQRWPDLSRLEAWQGTVAVAGLLHQPNLGFQLGDEPLSDTWPQRLQGLDMDKLAVFYQQQGWSLSPAVLRVGPDQDIGFVKEWPLITMTPAKHIGYAWQWFLMALVSTGLFFWFYQRGGLYAKK
ncbi:SURF1 family protein [Motilimonas cestriensis]|uniref:SURF1 family protein n=1 Tax=Motilimonas cestriensis TaxID=2742685 RepID=UPI003DA29817